MTVRVAVGLGSNLGNRARHVAEAVGSLGRVGQLVAVSALYETVPIGGPDQGPFLNAVAVIDTQLTAPDLLEECLRVEREQGRERGEKWGPRTLDLDVLLYGNESIDIDGLTVPHPRLTERRFVLEPLLEAWPDAMLPDGTALRDRLPGVSDQEVRRLEGAIPSRAFSGAAVVATVGAVLALWWLLDLVLG